MNALPSLQQQQDALKLLAGTLHTIPDEDPLRYRVALLVLDIQEYAKRTPQPSLFPCTLSDLARAIQEKGAEVQDEHLKKLHLNCRTETLRNLYVLEFLADKDFMEGIDYQSTPDAKTKIHLSSAAVQFLAEHYQGLLSHGRKPQKRKRKQPEIR